MRNKSLALRQSALAWACACSVALGHAGPRIYLDIENGKVLTIAGPYPEPEDALGNVSTNPTAYVNYAPSLVFPGSQPDETGGTAGVLPLSWDDDPLNFQTEFPGIQTFGPGTITSGTQFNFNIMGEVQWYDASTNSFEPISRAFPVDTPLIAVNNDLGQIAFSGTSPVPGYLAFTYNGNPTDHEHLTFTICTPSDLADGFSPEDAPAGIYALPLQLTSPSATAPSSTMYILFGDRGPNLSVTQAAMDAEMQQAILTADETLVPTASAWQVDAAGTWSNPANWLGTAIPNGVDNTATFGPQTTAARSVSLDVAVTLGNLNFTSNYGYTIAGPGALTLSASTGPAQITVYAGNHAITAPVVAASPLDVLITQAGSSLTLTDLEPTSQPLTLTGAGTLVAVELNVGALTVSGGTLQVAAHGPGSGPSVAVASGLSVVGGGFVDLSNNDLVIEGGSESDVGALVRTWLSGGASAGGLGSSLAGTGGANALATIGVITNDDGEGGALYSTFDGAPVARGEVLVKYTYIGDTTLKGYVDASDLANTLAGLNGGLTGWENGDFTYAGQVTPLDVQLLLTSLQDQGASFGLPGAGGGAVPEPSTWAVLGLGASTFLRRRRAGGGAC